jgi:DedD protein
MAFFKFRKGADEAVSAPVPAQSIEAIRQRAKYRLVGAMVLVLAGVIGLPLLFDKQPRPIAVDTPILIPDKNKVQPLVLPAPPATPTSSAAQNTVPAAPVVAEKTSLKPVPGSDAGVITETAEPPKASGNSDKKAPAAKVLPGQVAAKKVAVESPAPAKPVASTKPAASATGAKPTEATRAQALLDGAGVAAKPSEAKSPDVQTEAGGRYVVQIGAYTDNARAHEVRLKVEHGGLKTYTQVAETKDGRRIRVRVGPFATKAEAEKAAEKIKKLSLPAALLTL